MINYDPNEMDGMIQSIPEDAPTTDKKSIPTGLLKNEPEKKIDESQMADFSTPIEEVMAGPGMMMQDEVMGPSMPTSGNKKVRRSEPKSGSSGNPFGLTDEQYQAAVAGVAAVIAFSKPVQDRLQGAIPSMMGEDALTATGMAVTALVAAIVYFLAQRFLKDK
jgi:hypothetical protein